MSDAAENHDAGDIQDDIKTDTAEDVARKGGWRPESEWDSDDPKKPESFSSAEVFNARGEFIGRLKAQDKRLSEMESQFNTRLDNSNKLHKAQMEAQKADLVSKRDAAIDLADRESANKIQGQIDNLDIPVEAAPANNQQASLDSWNAANPWVFQAGPKAAYAQAQLNQYLGSGQDINAAIANMESDINREFPAINNNRNNEPIPEGGSRAGGGKKTGRSLTMADLTREEQNIYRNMPGTWDSEAAFLKAVQDSRGS